MAAETGYTEIKQWAERTGRRSVQMWLREDALRKLDRLCEQRELGRAEVLGALIREASDRRL
jgi:hypothetical protein